MALFNFGKKKDEEKKAPACACSCGCSANEAENSATECCPDVKEGEICCIKVLGAGCKSCHEQYENAKQAVKDMGLSVEVEYITDMQKVISDFQSLLYMGHSEHNSKDRAKPTRRFPSSSKTGTLYST